jgi:hypothetical protein
MYDAFSVWEFVADTYLLKLQRLQNRILHPVVIHHRGTPVRGLNLTHLRVRLNGYITQETAEVIQNHQNSNVHETGQEESMHRKNKKHKGDGDKSLPDMTWSTSLH